MDRALLHRSLFHRLKTEHHCINVCELLSCTNNGNISVMESYVALSFPKLPAARNVIENITCTIFLHVLVLDRHVYTLAKMICRIVAGG
jgi:hypothetical protein